MLAMKIYFFSNFVYFFSKIYSLWINATEIFDLKYIWLETYLKFGVYLQNWVGCEQSVSEKGNSEQKALTQ